MITTGTLQYFAIIDNKTGLGRTLIIACHQSPLQSSCWWQPPSLTPDSTAHLSIPSFTCLMTPTAPSFTSATTGKQSCSAAQMTYYSILSSKCATGTITSSIVTAVSQVRILYLNDYRGFYYFYKLNKICFLFTN